MRMYMSTAHMSCVGVQLEICVLGVYLCVCVCVCVCVCIQNMYMQVQYIRGVWV